MYDNGEGENIALLLFGKGERGKRRIRTTAPMAQRNWFRILPEVKRLVAQGLSIKPATRRVAKEVHLSPSHVEKLYYQRRIKKSPIS